MELDISNVTLYRMSLPDHDCPWGLKAIALLNERQIPFEEHLLTSRNAVESFKDEHNVSTTPQIFAGKRRIGGYGELAEWLGEKPERADYSYQPVIAVFGTTLLMALSLQGAIIREFMAFSICALAMLKLMDVESFAESFIKYDLITQKFKLWGKIYPGIELLMGLGFLLTPPVPIAGWVGLVIGAVGMWSVVKAVYIDKLALNCACVGGNSKTPLGIISFSEYAILSVMGALIAFNLAF